MAGGHAVHADAREGRHVADGGVGSWRAHGHSGTLVREGRHVADGGAGSWRAHGHSGTVVREGGGNAISGYLRPPYLSTSFPNSFSVWDYVPHVSYLVGHVGASRGVSNDHAALIAWTRVHAIIHQRTCAIAWLSEMLVERHVAA